MITMESAWEWLNTGGSTQIQPDAAQALNRALQNASIPEMQSEIRKVIAACRIRSHAASMELPEVLVFAARVFYRMGTLASIQEASLYANEAVSSYPSSQPQRIAAAKWIQGILERRLDNLTAAFRCWHESYELMEALSKEPSFPPERQDWIKGMLHKILVDLTGTIENGYAWYDAHEANHFREHTKFTSDAVFRQQAERRMGDVQSSILSLQSMAKEGKEHLEISDSHFQAGIARYQMGDLAGAIKDLTTAISKARAGSHQQAVALWVQGLIQVDLPAWKDKGITNCSRAIELFEELRKEAEHKNRKEIVAWYREKHPLMIEVLQEKLNLSFS